MATTPNYGLYMPSRNDNLPVDNTLSNNFLSIDNIMRANKDLTNEVNDRISQIIAGSETSSTETVDARGPFAVLRDRLDDMTNNLIQRSINVRTPFGTGLTALKGDGTDETTLIQAFFDYAKNNGSVTLYFPEGTYSISSYIRLYKNTTVFSHQNTIFKRIGTTFKFFINGQSGNSTYATGYNGEGNIHFVGGTIDLNQSTLSPTQTLSVFDLGHGENITFTKLKIKNGQIGHYFQVSSCKNVRFKDCWFGDVVQSDGGASTNYEVLQIEEATATSFPTFGGYDQTPSQDIYIENCTFENVIRAIGTHSTNYNVPATNINIIGCIFKNCYDNALSLYQYNNVTVRDNYINGAQYGINTNVVNDSLFAGNIIMNTQKSGVNITSSNGNKFSKNLLKEICLSTGASYSAFRITSSNDNTWDDDTVTAVTPNYSNAWFSSGGSTGNKIISHNYKKGTITRISGADDTEKANYQVGAGQEILFDGDLGTNGATGTLSHDIRNYNFIIIVGNDNSSATATLTTMTLPKSIYLFATTSRFRLVADDSNANDRVDFSFPNGTTIQADAITGTCHIRKVIGIV